MRVNGASLAQHTNQRVALVGEVVSSGDQTVLKAAVRSRRPHPLPRHLTECLPPHRPRAGRD